MYLSFNQLIGISFEISASDLLSWLFSFIAIVISLITLHKDNSKPTINVLEAFYYKFKDEDRRTGKRIVYQCAVSLNFINNSKYPINLIEAKLNSTEYVPIPNFKGIYFIRNTGIIHYYLKNDPQPVYFPMTIEAYQNKTILFCFNDITSMVDLLDSPVESKKENIDKEDKHKRYLKKYKFLNLSGSSTAVFKMKASTGKTFKVNLKLNLLK